MDNYYFELFKDERKELENLFNSGEYHLCIEKNKALLRSFKSSGTDDYNMWHCYFMMSKCYNNLGNVTMALTNIKKASEYILSININKVKASHYWMVARYYGNFKDKKAINIALKNYFMCSDIYSELNDKVCYAMVWCNIALLQNNIDLMNDEVIERYKELVLEGKMNVQRLDNVYSSLCEMYLNSPNGQFNLIKAQSVLHNISDIKLKEELLKKMFSQSERIV